MTDRRRVSQESKLNALALLGNWVSAFLFPVAFNTLSGKKSVETSRVVLWDADLCFGVGGIGMGGRGWVTVTVQTAYVGASVGLDSCTNAQNRIHMRLAPVVRGCRRGVPE